MRIKSGSPRFVPDAQDCGHVVAGIGNHGHIADRGLVGYEYLVLMRVKGYAVGADSDCHGCGDGVCSVRNHGSRVGNGVGYEDFVLMGIERDSVGSCADRYCCDDRVSGIIDH